MNAAHVHLILNHIPVLGSVATLGLILYAAMAKNEALKKLALQVMVLIGVLTIPVYFSGEPAEGVVEHLPGVTEAFISKHEDFALFGFLLTEILAVTGIAGLVLQKKHSPAFDRYWKLIGAVAFANVLLMMAIANLGGEIRHTEIRGAATGAPELPQGR
jgi:hypothetical protein